MGILGLDFLPSFLSAATLHLKIARIGMNKSFTVIGEFIEDDGSSLDAQGNLHAYEFIEEDNKLNFVKGPWTEVDSQGLWSETTGDTWNDLPKYIWAQVVELSLRVFSHEFIEIDILE